MNIFESLENLQVSEECFDDIINIIEEYINEVEEETVDNVLDKRYNQWQAAKEIEDNAPEETSSRAMAKISNKREKLEDKYWNAVQHKYRWKKGRRDRELNSYAKGVEKVYGKPLNLLTKNEKGEIIQNQRKQFQGKV